MKTVEVFAPAKINLALHVTGRREDGYHLLDSLVTFAPVGDTLTIEPAERLDLLVEGPEALGVPAGEGNLAHRAALLAAGGATARITLFKRLPAASGIGGGSSDAAAAFRGMTAFRDGAEVDAMLAETDDMFSVFAMGVAALGADVPMCLLPHPLRARGTGTETTAVRLPDLPAVLVNPRVPVSTADVFRALETPDNDPLPDAFPAFGDPRSVIDWLHAQRNDLERPAKQIAPIVSDVLAAIGRTAGCGIARMSGSGATCFGLFETEAQAAAAARAIAAAHARWWVVPATLGDMTAASMPRMCEDMVHASRPESA